MRLTMRHPALLALGVGLAMTATTGLAGAATTPATGHASPVVGHLYVNDNTAGANTVAGYDRHRDGALTPIPGSPFATGGAGTGKVIGSQGALQKADRGHLLVAVDPGSNQLSVLRVVRGGALVTVDTVASGGDTPVSVAVAGDRVYVANAGADSDYTVFALGSTGTLAPLAHSTVTLPAGSQPGDILVNRTGTRVVATRVASSLIDSFSVGPAGRLHAAVGSPYAAQGPGSFGSEFSPTDPDEVFISNAHGGADAGTVSAFADGPGATLTSIGDGPFANHQTAPCWVTISRDGRFLYTVNTAVPSVSSYAVTRSGGLRLLANAPFAAGSGAMLGPEDARLTPDQHTLWVVDSAGDALSAFHVAVGRVTATGAPFALPAGAAPFGIVIE